MGGMLQIVGGSGGLEPLQHRDRVGHVGLSDSHHRHLEPRAVLDELGREHEVGAADTRRREVDQLSFDAPLRQRELDAVTNYLR